MDERRDGRRRLLRHLGRTAGEEAHLAELAGLEESTRARSCSGSGYQLSFAIALPEVVLGLAEDAHDAAAPEAWAKGDKEAQQKAQLEEVQISGTVTKAVMDDRQKCRL